MRYVRSTHNSEFLALDYINMDSNTKIFLVKQKCKMFLAFSFPEYTSRPSDISYVINVPRLSFFAALPLLCIILNANQRTKSGKTWKLG